MHQIQNIKEPFLRITLVKSKYGRIAKHVPIISGLGLRKIGHSVIRKNDAAIRGMVEKIFYLISVEGVNNEAE